jgi:ABC-type thiamin/hydroxymethylpyrimidine transport system permease subunit
MDVHRPIHMLFHVVSCCFICLGNLIHSHVFLVVFRMNILLETHTHTINLQRAARFVSYISWFITSLMGGLIVIINA